MNRMKEVAELLGVELGEWFKVKTKEGNVIASSYVITEEHLQNDCFDIRDNRMVDLLTGKLEIIKQPWTPKEGESYYIPSFRNELYEHDRWYGSNNTLSCKRNVGVYRTKEEAIVKAKELGWT
jgi:hypothetical protein